MTEQGTPGTPREEVVDLDNPAASAKAPAKVSDMNSATPDLSKKTEGLTTAESLLQQIVTTSEDEWIPWEEIGLPSRGVYYGEKLPGGVVKIRAMGIHAEKILATQRLASSGQSIDYLFNHCIQLPDGFDQSELLVGDRVFLLYALRGMTHGNIYEFVMKCPNCEASSAHKYDLNELAGTTKYPDMSIGLEPFKVELPYTSESLKKKVWVKVRFMRGKDLTFMANRVRFNKRAHGANVASGPGRQREIIIDQTVTENLALIVESFGGEGMSGEVKDRIRLKQLVEKLHAKDSSTIRQYLKDYSPGIDTTIQLECPDCGNESRTELPITESFFRPTGSRKSE